MNLRKALVWLFLSMAWGARAQDFNILAYGALADSTVNNTAAFRKAIQAAHQNGGGRVVVPAGTFTSGTIQLLDNVELHLSIGARIKGSPNHEDYTPTERKASRLPNAPSEHLIYAKGAKNIAITGLGTIDGNGYEFWQQVPKPMPQWIGFKPDRVSNMVELVECKGIVISDVKLIRSPEWTIHCIRSSDIQIHGITLDNDLYGPNADGIDISNCQRVIISRCQISTCDDAVCLKTFPGGGPTEDVLVSNCNIVTSCVALKVGNESYKDIRRVRMNHCNVQGTNRIIGLYAENGGTIEDIYFSDISGNTNSVLLFPRPIHLSLRKAWGKGPYQDSIKTESAMRNIQISNCDFETEGRILMAAEEGMKIEGVSLQNVRLRHSYIDDPSRWAAEVTSAQNNPNNPEARVAQASLVAEGVSDLSLVGCEVHWPKAKKIPMHWRYPIKIANGTFKQYQPDYENQAVAPASWQLMWNKRTTFASKELKLVAPPKP